MLLEFFEVNFIAEITLTSIEKLPYKMYQEKKHAKHAKDLNMSLYSTFMEDYNLSSKKCDLPHDLFR